MQVLMPFSLNINDTGHTANQDIIRHYIKSYRMIQGHGVDLKTGEQDNCEMVFIFEIDAYPLSIHEK